MQSKKRIGLYVSAVLDRHNGTPYAKVLEKYSSSITPNQFYGAVRRIGSFIPLLDVTKETRHTLERIAQDEMLQREMFDMGEEFIQLQFKRIAGKIPGEEQWNYYKGTYLHPKNIEFLIYHALTSSNPKLASTNRDEVIEEIRNLQAQARHHYFWEYHFSEVGMGKIITTLAGINKVNNIIPYIWDNFNRAYQRRTGNPSLFDSSQNNFLEFDDSQRLFKVDLRALEMLLK